MQRLSEIVRPGRGREREGRGGEGAHKAALFVPPNI